MLPSTRNREDNGSIANEVPRTVGIWMLSFRNVLSIVASNPYLLFCLIGVNSKLLKNGSTSSSTGRGLSPLGNLWL